jgi:glycosyltransferase involved in cell wall biosynthesis
MSGSARRNLPYLLLIAIGSFSVAWLLAAKLGDPPRNREWGPIRRVTVVAMVRNANASVAALINSTLPHVQGYVFCDTGSDDGTLEFLRNFKRRHELGDSVFVVESTPWKDHFARSRNACLKVAAKTVTEGFLLLMDADDTLEVRDPNWRRSIGPATYYTVPMMMAGSTWQSARLITADHSWSYRCAVHEYLDMPANVSLMGRMGGIALRNAGAGNATAKQLRNLRLLYREPDEEERQYCYTRNLFYIAQTYFDLKNYRQAADAYRRRLEVNDTYAEERYFSAYRLASAVYRATEDLQKALPLHLRAWEMRPTRGEALYDLMNALYRAKDYAQCHMVGERLVALSWPSGDQLFVHQAAYDHVINADMAADCAYRSGSPSRAQQLWQHALGTTNARDKARIQKNLHYLARHNEL